MSSRFLVTPLLVAFFLATAVLGKDYSGIDGSKMRGFTCYNNLTAADVDSVKQWGGNTLRIMVTIHDLHNLAGYDTCPNLNIDPAKLAKIVNVVNLCRDRGMTAIINYWETPGLVRWSGWKDFRIWQEDRVGKRFRNLVVETWKLLAGKFVNYPVSAVAYELFNEPEPKSNDWDAPEIQGYLWDSLQAQLIREIRKIDLKHTIIAAPPYGWRVNSITPHSYVFGKGENKSEHAGWIPPSEILNDGKTMVTVHMYHPHDFTIQWRAWADSKIKGKAYPGNFNGDIWDECLWNKEKLRQTMAPISEFQKLHPNVPVIVTEFSAIRVAPGAAQYLADVISVMKELNVGWTYHTYKERRYLADKKGCDDTMWELELSEVPKEGRVPVTNDPLDRFKAVVEGFNNLK